MTLPDQNVCLYCSDTLSCSGPPTTLCNSNALISFDSFALKDKRPIEGTKCQWKVIIFNWFVISEKINCLPKSKAEVNKWSTWDKSRYFFITELNYRLIIRSPSFVFIFKSFPDISGKQSAAFYTRGCVQLRMTRRLFLQQNILRWNCAWADHFFRVPLWALDQWKGREKNASIDNVTHF